MSRLWASLWWLILWYDVFGAELNNPPPHYFGESRDVWFGDGMAG